MRRVTFPCPLCHKVDRIVTLEAELEPALLLIVTDLQGGCAVRISRKTSSPSVSGIVTTSLLRRAVHCSRRRAGGGVAGTRCSTRPAP